MLYSIIVNIIKIVGLRMNDHPVVSLDDEKKDDGDNEINSN